MLTKIPCALVLLVLTAPMTLSHLRSAEELLHEDLLQYIPAGLEKHVVQRRDTNDDYGIGEFIKDDYNYEYPNDEEQKPDDVIEDANDDTPVEVPLESTDDDRTATDDVESPPVPDEDGSGDDFKLEPRISIDDDSDKGENIILKYLTDNPDVTDLDLSNKEFSAISATMFQEKLENLRTIDLQKNVLATIDKNAFTSLPRLEVVNLSTNALTTLDTETFSRLPALQELDLSANPLELPTGSLFLNSPTLRRLKMGGCNLKQIPENAFDGMTSLEELDLGGNPIFEETPLTAAAFLPLTNLTNLTLPESSENDILIREICKGHGLLPAICIESCDSKTISCSQVEADSDDTPSKVDPMVAKAEFTKLVSETVTSSLSEDEPKLVLGTGRMVNNGGLSSDSTGNIEDLADNAPRKVVETAEEEEKIPESSKSGVTGAGVNQTIIGLLVGGLIAVIAGILLKKNWSKIRGKKEEPTRRSTVTVARVASEDVERGSPETIPLKSNNEKIGSA